MKTKLNALSAWLDRHALPLGAALAAALSLLLALTMSAAARWAT